MSLVTSIHAQGHGDSSLLDGIAQALAPERRAELHEVMGLAVRDLVKAHLVEYDANHSNALGGKRTHFYGDAARATASYADSSEAVVTVARLGIRLQYYGGVVKAGKNPSSYSGKPTRFLTIPAVAEAHGTRASEWPNLTFTITDRGPALAEAAATPVKMVTRRGTSKFKRLGKEEKVSWKTRGYEPALSFGGQAGSVGGRVIFWLARSVTVGPHPDILPDEANIRAEAVSAGWRWIMRKQGKELLT